MREIETIIRTTQDGELVVSSRDIAVGLRKRHDDVIRKIRETLGLREFSESSYVNEQGRKFEQYLLGRDSFILLMMNYSGYNDFKRAYIKRFTEMESILKNQSNSALTDSQLELQTKQLEIEQMRERRLSAEVYLNLAKGYEGTKYKQILEAYATKELNNGEFVLSLPKLERKTYSASEIGKMLGGITANMVGRLTNKHNLKTPEYGEWFMDKSKYSSRETETFRYYETVLEPLRAILRLENRIFEEVM
jgi:Rha family phage regulatory protein